LTLEPFLLTNAAGTTLQSFAYLGSGGGTKGKRFNAYTYFGKFHG